MLRARHAFGAALAFTFAVSWAVFPGCGSDDESTFTDPTLGAEAGSDSPGGPGPFANDGGADGSAGCAAGCPKGTTCVAGKCLPPQSCADGGACQFDTYCDKATGQCVPFGGGKNNDDACKLSIAPGNFAPKIKCSFPTTIPIPGDTFPNHVDVQATPMVARLGGPAAPPSIVVPFTQPVAGGYTESLGVIRVLKGTDCAQEAVLGGVDLNMDGNIDWARSSSPVALADLDGDKNPEIIAYMVYGANEVLVAFTKKAGTWAPLWTTVFATAANGTTIHTATVPAVSGGNNSWAGPAVHDLDDDGKPEIIREGFVFNGQTGKLRAGLPAGYDTYRVGVPPVLANLDADPRIELTNGAKVWEFDGVTDTWVEDATYGAVVTPPGWAAVADFNPFDGKKQAEIAVTYLNGGTSMFSLYNADHTLFMNMDITVPGTGGGPPTIADFDGDGLPEVATAGRAFYTVFDPDCQATPRPGGKCLDRTHCDHTGGPCPDYILWSRATQDISSNITGSSIFDFEADGKSEVVYADECFARVYGGSDGRVIFSRFRSSCTWLENPIIVDVDGDFRAEMVVPSNTACGPIGVGQACTAQIDAQGVDSQFAGLVCLKGTDCGSGVCDNGLCRCTTSAECCADKDVTKCEAFGTKCATPPVGTPGTGNTCRANHPTGVQGIRIFEDAQDRWVRSRTIWNQYSYAVTHVNEDGTIPKTSAWANNWTQAGLNNFRQNVPGTADARDIGDLTSQVATAYLCSAGKATLASQVCNRGTAPIGAGVSVGFYSGGTKVCSGTTKNPLAVGQCESVSCEWLSPPLTATEAIDITVVPNDDGSIAQCNADNDKGLVVGVFCTAPK